MHAQGDDGQSQWAVLLDPNGAAFGIIPVLPAGAMPSTDGGDSPDAAHAVGRIAWLDLTVPDASAAQEFYQRVVGWSVQEREMLDGSERYADYDLLRENGPAVAAVRHARGANAGLPGVWMIYMSVRDLDESLRRVREEGGRVINSEQGDDGQYLHAAIEDPVGVYVGLMAE